MTEKWYAFPELRSFAPRIGPYSVNSSTTTRTSEAFYLLPRCDFQSFTEADDKVREAIRDISSYPLEGLEAKFAQRMLENAQRTMVALNAGFDESVEGGEWRNDSRRATIMEDEVGSIPLHFSHTVRSLLKSALTQADHVFRVTEEEKEVLREVIIQGKTEVGYLPTGKLDPDREEGNRADRDRGSRPDGEERSRAQRERSGGANRRGGSGAGGGVNTKDETGSGLPNVLSRSLTPDVQLWTESTVRKAGRHPLASVALKRPALNVRDEFYLENVAARMTAMCKKIKDGRDVTPLLTAIAQAILYCLHSSSGVSILTDINSVTIVKAFFPESLEKIGKNSESARVTVKASQMYYGGKLLPAYVGYFRYVMSNPDAGHSWAFNGRFMKEVLSDSRASNRWDKSGKLEGAKEKDPQEQGLTPGNIDAAKGGAAGISPTESDDSRTGDGMLVDNMSSILASYVQSNLIEKVATLTFDDVEEVISSSTEHLNSSNRFTVCKGMLGNMTVVLKFGRIVGDRETEEMLCGEIWAHHYLYKQTCGDYGERVSRLIGYGDVPVYGVVLITEYVGYEVDEERDVVRCDGEIVTGEDLHRLATETLRSLRYVHDQGLLHGDIDYRNLRAIKLEGDWRVWWIDLGCASKHETYAQREAEEENCMSLFSP